MKKIYVLLLVTAGFVLSASAQPFEKGDKFLGGSFNFSSASTNSAYSQKDYGFGFSPSIGFFTRKSQLTGISLNYQYSNSTVSNTPLEITANSFGAGIYKQYWTPIGEKFYFIIEGRTGVNFSNSKYKDTLNRQDQSSNSFYAAFTINPGFAYRIKKRLVLDFFYSNFLSANYMHTKSKTGNTTFVTGNSFSIDAGLRSFTTNNFLLGFRYML